VNGLVWNDALCREYLTEQVQPLLSLVSFGGATTHSCLVCCVPCVLPVAVLAALADVRPGPQRAGPDQAGALPLGPAGQRARAAQLLERPQGQHVRAPPISLLGLSSCSSDVARRICVCVCVCVCVWCGVVCVLHDVRSVLAEAERSRRARHRHPSNSRRASSACSTTSLAYRPPQRYTIAAMALSPCGLLLVAVTTCS
jgi:hypothetical protein